VEHRLFPRRNQPKNWLAFFDLYYHLIAIVVLAKLIVQRVLEGLPKAASKVTCASPEPEPAIAPSNGSPQS
jgi:hypothetical protein